MMQGLFMARRLNHDEAKLPAPTQELLVSLQLEIYDAFRAAIQPLADVELEPLAAVHPSVRDAWLMAARAAYATMALAGGAGETTIRSEED